MKRIIRMFFLSGLSNTYWRLIPQCAHWKIPQSIKCLHNLRIWITLALSLLTSSVIASCLNLYPQQLVITPQSSSVVEVCRSFYVLQYDQNTRSTIFTSQRLRPYTPIGSPKRLSGFRADTQVRNSPRNDYYTGTGWDRGHLVPAEDASTVAEMYDTFYLTNVVPQSPMLNRGQWKTLEAKLRAIAINSVEDVYIITIPVYTGAAFISNSVPIPTGLWKVLIVGSTESYFFAYNSPTAKVVQYYEINWRNLVVPH